MWLSNGGNAAPTRIGSSTLKRSRWGTIRFQEENTIIPLKTLTKCLCVAIVLAQAAPLQPASAGDTRVKKFQTAHNKVLRRVPANRGRLVPQGSSFKARGGYSKLTCCTHWNTQSGGTGCATYDDSEGLCPGETF